MDKIIKYIDVMIPMQACTLRCSYCYLSQVNHSFSGGLPHFDFDAKFFRKALSKQRVKGVARINLCGDGETMLIPDLIDFVQELLNEGHWVDIVTNGTVTKTMNQLTLLPSDYKQRLFLKISLHYIELKKRNMLDSFFQNIDTIRKSGISFSLLLTGSDDYIPYIDEIKRVCIEHVGALPHVSFARNDDKPYAPLQSKYKQNEYHKLWSQFDSALLTFQNQIFGIKRKEFCMGGAWTYVLNMQTGELRNCHNSLVIQNIYENLTEPIKEEAIGHFCRARHCVCGPIWLTLGAIPEMETPLYSEIRNRICADGTEWLTAAQKEAMSIKLANGNNKPTMSYKLQADTHTFLKIYIPKIKRRIHKIFK